MVEFKTNITPEIMFAANGDLKVILTAPRFYAKQFDSLPKGKELAVEIKQYRKKRSLDANAYFWLLCDRVAQAVGNTTKEDIYRAKIRDVGVYEDIEYDKSECMAKVKMWSEIGVGWFCDRFCNLDIGDKIKIRRYYGSSVYDSSQMWRLINSIIDDCSELGIPTMTPEEMRSLCNTYNVD